VSDVELREASNGKLELRGHASVADVWYPIGADVEEKIVPRAFVRSLNSEPDVVLRLEHGGLPLARTRSATGTPTLRLSEDKIGLLAEAELNASDPDVIGLKAKADNSPLQMSFTFRCNRDRWSEDYKRREVLEANLSQGDVSVVTFGANPATSMTINSRGGIGTFEQRKALAERVRGYISGPGGFVTSGDFTGRAAMCARCGGEGSVTIRCPNCGGSDGEGEEGEMGVYGRGAASSDFLVFARKRATELRAGRVVRTGDAVEDAKHALAAHRALDTGKERDRMRAREHEIEMQRERDRDARRSRERRMREAGWR
jgi:HK97 family phage prohead protease